MSASANTHFIGYNNRIDFYETAHGEIPNGNANTVTDDWLGFSLNINRSVKANSTFTTNITSTYSLVYTAGLYTGGVLAPNGDIHFVPFLAPVGQKISAAGVVSTYTLVYTTSSGAYAGGVIAPNGNIHFIPTSGNRGQIIHNNSGITFPKGVLLHPYLNKF